VAKRKANDLFSLAIYIFFFISIAWNMTGSSSFTYFWIICGLLASVFLVYHAFTWKNDIKKAVNKNKKTDT
jgi:membrane associated rhomboid family serine protease